MITRRSGASVIGLTLLLVGCSGGAPSTVATPVAVRTSASPTPAPPVAVDPLTGTAPPGAARVVVLKVDNSPLARPYQRGLAAAALVFQELMEGGSTRLLALYDNGFAGEVGPVRSVRESDPDLLGQFGPVALGFSGGNEGVKAGFRTAVRAGQIFDASYDAFPGLYRLGERRADARNFFTTPARLAAAVPGATTVRPSGLRFGPMIGGTPAATAAASFSGDSTVRVAADPTAGRWSVFQDGRQMTDYAPANVIVQSVPVRASRYQDIHGVNTPFTVSTGGGAVSVLRDGKRVDGTWQRANVSGVTRYLDIAGQDLRLKPGPTLVLLLPAGRPLTTG